MDFKRGPGAYLSLLLILKVRFTRRVGGATGGGGKNICVDSAGSADITRPPPLTVTVR